MNENKSLVSAGAAIAQRNKRYIVWFYLLNLAFAHFGASAFSEAAHSILDHSLYADKLLHGFNLGVFTEMLARPEFGTLRSATHPAMMFAVVFFLASLVFMPGVLLGYASDHRLPRDEFFRACGRNVWRFVRLFGILHHHRRHCRRGFIRSAERAGHCGGQDFQREAAILRTAGWNFDHSAGADGHPHMV